MNPEFRAEELVAQWIAKNKYYLDGPLHQNARASLVRLISGALTDVKPKKATKEKA